MGPEGSLQLLNLTSHASVDDANKAYAALNREIHRYHSDSAAEGKGDFQEDIELLTCAYERAVAFLSENHAKGNPADCDGASRLSVSIVDSRTTSNSMKLPIALDAGVVPPCQENASDDLADHRTVEEAISITTRKLRETQSAMPRAQQAVDAAKKALEQAKRRVKSAKQTNLNAMVSAKSATIRALLLDVEAKKADKAARAAAEKAREKAISARRVADEAREHVDQIKEQVIRAKKSEEAAIAEAICAEDKMEKELVRLRALELKLLEIRNCMRVFQETAACHKEPDAGSAIGARENASASERLLSELQKIEVVDDLGTPAKAVDTAEPAAPGIDGESEDEKRQYRRIVYPMRRRPQFVLKNKAIPVLDLSAKGMRLESDKRLDHSVLRGAIEFPGASSLPVAGKVVRRDANGVGVHLVTRIGKQVLERERLLAAG